MRLFNDDPDTDAVIMIGEIGGPDEAEAARWCKANMKKPIVGFIAGVTAPAGQAHGPRRRADLAAAPTPPTPSSRSWKSAASP